MGMRSEGGGGGNSNISDTGGGGGIEGGCCGGGGMRDGVEVLMNRPRSNSLLRLAGGEVASMNSAGLVIVFGLIAELRRSVGDEAGRMMVLIERGCDEVAGAWRTSDALLIMVECVLSLVVGTVTTCAWDRNAATSPRLFGLVVMYSFIS